VNPELLRNLWLQFSLQRVIAAPLILGAIVALISFGTSTDWSSIAWAANGGFFLIAYLWGARRAVNVLADEIASGTWDGQRMSSIGPWTMAWGKIFGGTAYTWYCAGICLVAYIIAEIKLGNSNELLLELSLQMTGALLVQAVALLLALVMVGKGRRLGRRSIAFAQGAAVLIGFFGVSHLLLPSIGLHLASGLAQSVTWFGLNLPFEQFVLLTQCLFLAWVLVGVYRLMASELQVPQGPWVWTLFSVFLIAYYQGFAVLGNDSGPSLRWASALVVAVILYYVAIFAQSHDIIRYRWLLHHNRRGALGGVWTLAPLWAPSLVIAVIVAASLRYSAPIAALAEPELQGLLSLQHVVDPRHMTTALILFMVRDLGIVLLLNFAQRPKAPDLTAVLYLIVLYGVGGGLAIVLGAYRLLPWFVPGAGGNGLLVMLAPLIEVLAVFALLWRRWTAQGRALQPQPAA